MTKTVVVIGAGIVGVSSALWTQRDGHKVILIDREGPAAGTSFGNGGVLASSSIVPVSTPGLLWSAPRMLFNRNKPLFIKWGYLPKLLPYLVGFLGNANAKSVRARAAAMTHLLSDSVNDHLTLAEGTGAERYIVPSDYLFIYRNRAHYEADNFGWDLRKEFGFNWEVLDGQSFQDYDPVFGPGLTCAARCPDHGRISDPGAYVTALAKHFETQGGQFIRGEVTDIARENGSVSGVRVSGEFIPCDTVVIATGVWSAKLAASLAVKVPIESERGYHLELWEPNIMPKSPVMVASGKFVATPMDGRLRLAGVVEFGGLNAPPSKAPLELLEKNIQEAIPRLTWEEKTEWMGHRPAIMDSTPMIGETPKVKGAFLAFGHDHVGLTGGPKTGQLISQLISQRQPNIDMSPYSPARFASS